MFSWHAIPFARIIMPFIAGIFIAVNLPAGWIAPTAALFGFTVFFLILHFSKNVFVNYRARLICGVTISAVIILLGYLRTYWFNETRHAGYFGGIRGAAAYQLTVDDAVVEKQKHFRCYARVENIVDSSGRLHATKGTVLFYLRKASSLRKPMIGDRYLVRTMAAEIQEPANPEEFNYKRYLEYHNIYRQIYADSTQITETSDPCNSIYRYAVILRDRSLEVLKKYIDSPAELGVAEALLLGFKDDLDPDITAAFSRTGTLHVLAVSGLHAGIIYMILAFISGPLLKRKNGKVIQVIILLSGIWMYAFMTGLSSSVLRASIMFSFISFGKLLRYHINIYNNIFSSAFILLMYNPFFILDVGFQLSYMAVLGIVFIQPMISKWYVPESRLVKYIWDLISVSLAAQLLTFPISIFYFHQFPNYFLLSNLIIIPVTSVVLIGLIALLALHFLPLLGDILGKAILWVLKFNNRLVQGIDELPFSYVEGVHFNLLQMVMAYVILILFLAFCIHKKKYQLFGFLGSVICFITYLLLLRYSQNNQRVLTIHAIKGHDVFTCLDGRHASIISDSNFIRDESAIRYFIKPYLWSRGVSEISKFDLQNDFTITNLCNVKNVGFQFYDRILTINFSLPKSVQKNGIILLKEPDIRQLTKLMNSESNLIISTNQPRSKIRNLRREYFKQNNKILKEHKSFILFSL